MKHRFARIIGMITLLIVSMATLTIETAVPASAAVVGISYTGSTTSSNCVDARMCGNIKTTSSCSGTGNRCYAYNGNGGANDLAIGNTVDGVLGSSGQRMINRNSGTLRRACGYSGSSGAGVQSAAIAYYGWGIMPFTGIKSMAAVPVGASNCNLSAPG